MSKKGTNKTEWHCPNCGELPKDKIKIYNEKLRKQNFTIYPILPTCKMCGLEVVLNKNNNTVNKRNAIILTGTCASGKSTTAKWLMDYHNYYCIEGDCVLSLLKNRLGNKNIKFDSLEVLKEIEYQIDILLALDKDIVISHVITPSNLPKYIQLFQSRNLNFKIFVLQPSLNVAVKRSKTRTWFTTITPEKWVKHFHDEYRLLPQDIGNVVVFDNSYCTVEESVDRILEMFKE